MDLAYVFSNHSEWIQKVNDVGYEIETLFGIIKEMTQIFQEAEVQETEDFVYRLKCCHDKINGKSSPSEQDLKLPARISVSYKDSKLFFKLCPNEVDFKRKETLFYCELCGFNTKMKTGKLKAHINECHS